MDKYVCPCGYVYDPAVGDPENGVAPGTPWEKVKRKHPRGASFFLSGPVNVA